MYRSADFTGGYLPPCLPTFGVHSYDQTSLKYFVDLVKWINRLLASGLVFIEDSFGKQDYGKIFFFVILKFQCHQCLFEMFKGDAKFVNL